MENISVFKGEAIYRIELLHVLPVERNVARQTLPIKKILKVCCFSRFFSLGGKEIFRTVLIYALLCYIEIV